MKKVIVIPARLDSSRLPKKVLLDLKGKTVIQRVYEQCLKVSNIDAVYIATDSLEIKDICDTFTSNAMLTKSRSPRSLLSRRNAGRSTPPCRPFRWSGPSPIISVERWPTRGSVKRRSRSVR